MLWLQHTDSGRDRDRKKMGSVGLWRCSHCTETDDNRDSHRVLCTCDRSRSRSRPCQCEETIRFKTENMTGVL